MGSGPNITRQMPVLIGDSNHVMAVAEITREIDKVTIVVRSTGEQGQLLASFLEQAEPIGLSFIALPIQNVRERERNI